MFAGEPNVDEVPLWEKPWIYYERKKACEIGLGSRVISGFGASQAG